MNGSLAYSRGSMLGILLCAAVLNGGCALFWVGAGAAGGVGTLAYVKGELKSTEAAGIDEVWSATQGAVEELQYTIVRKEKDALEANLVARDGSDTKVNIRLKKVGDSMTDIGIRVGLFGDEPVSRQILDRIQAQI